MTCLTPTKTPTAASTPNLATWSGSSNWTASADRGVVTAEYAARMASVIPRARLLIVPGSHGDYLGEQAASGADLRTMHATVPFLLRFLGE